jgi:transcriptional regulator with XRE-family HTH domain
MIPNKEYILQLAKQRGWNYAELARRSGVSPSTISRWIQGKRGAGRCLISGFIKAFPEEQIERLFFLSSM